MHPSLWNRNPVLWKRNGLSGTDLQRARKRVPEFQFWVAAFYSCQMTECTVQQLLTRFRGLSHSLGTHLALHKLTDTQSEPGRPEIVALRSVLSHQVKFQIRDIYFPEREKVLAELHGKEVLLGKVVDRSDGGEDGETFLVVQVEGLTERIVVPMRCVQEWE